MQGDISDRDMVFRVVEGVDCVWHNAAAVGPYHPEEVYVKASPQPPCPCAIDICWLSSWRLWLPDEQVNYEGTLNVIDACKQHGCRKLIFSSSPSTR